jgi:hypothetical protein
VESEYFSEQESESRCCKTAGNEYSCCRIMFSEKPSCKRQHQSVADIRKHEAEQKWHQHRDKWCRIDLVLTGRSHEIDKETEWLAPACRV